jgi:hypothetical protein
MEQRINRQEISIGTSLDLENKDREYWRNSDVSERLKTITYLRECFYGPEATTGRLQRLYKVFKQI